MKGRHWPLTDFLLMGDGAGGFRPARQLAGVADRSYSGVLADIDADGDLDIATIRSAEAADLDGDGLLDLVAIDERVGPYVYLRRGDGTFGSGRPLGDRKAPPYALHLEDLNRDGRTDVIIGHVEARPAAYFNDGRAMFTEVSFGDDEGVAYGFATGDIDEDGILDIAMARSDAPNVLYFGGIVGAR